MIEGGVSINTETKSTDNAETKSSAPEKLYQELAKVETKMNDMLFSEDNGEKQNGNEETKHENDGKQDNREASNDDNERDTTEKNSDVTSELLSRSISELMDRLFSDDKEEKSESDENNSEAEKNNSEANKSSDIPNQLSGQEGTKILNFETGEKDNPEGDLDVPRYVITRNEALENNRHPITGVWFEKRVIELPDGEKIEGVFPRFESVFDAKIPERLYLQPDKVQFRECNRQLAQEIEKNPELKKMFSEEQIEQIRDGIYDGTAPDGYVWHHDAEAGKLQLVDFETHSRTGHTGGRTLWGGGSDNR